MLAVLYCQMLEELALLDEDVDSHVCRCLPEHCTQSDVSPQGMKPDSGSWCYDMTCDILFVFFDTLLKADVSVSVDFTRKHIWLFCLNWYFRQVLLHSCCQSEIVLFVIYTLCDGCVGWWKWVVYEACDQQSGEKVERKARGVGQPHHGRDNERSSADQVRHYTENSRRSSAGWQHKALKLCH